MKYNDLVFERHPLLPDTWRASHKFPNGQELSVIKGQFINRIEVYDFSQQYPVCGLDPDDVDKMLSEAEGRNCLIRLT